MSKIDDKAHLGERQAYEIRARAKRRRVAYAGGNLPVMPVMFCYLALSPPLPGDPNIEPSCDGEKISFITPPEETEHGTRPGGRGPGGVARGVGSKKRGGHVREYKGGSIRIQRGVYPILPFCLCVCVRTRADSAKGFCRLVGGVIRRKSD